MKELPVARTARERFGIADLADLAAIRRATARLNAAPERTGRPERTVHAAQLHALSTIHRAFGRVLGRYGEQVDPKALDDALAALDLTLGRPAVDGVLETFASHFAAPPDRAGRLEGVLMTWLANTNPAAESFRELFDDTPLRALPGYGRVISGLAAHFHERPPFGPDDQPLVAMLRSPAVAIPESLGGQLGYIRERWGTLLDDLLDELLRGLDLLAEEERALWLRFHGAGGGAGAGASAAVYEFEAYADEPERFTPDRDWHPRTVLLAKSTHVWLHQLSRRYDRSIRTLDAIPDEELDRLARWGITGLWLIGVWQRSRASERIKRWRGNEDAAASAYSLDDYRVADDLGGEEGWASLRDRALRYGLRLASDMVPNHMGIDSRWVIEHPEWFLSLPEPPYPAYSFTGADLSDDPRVGIYLEDHYWDGTDAAVVFRRVDRATGESHYTYHGNDGTSFPWNDTAQLDYLRADVREQVIRTILDVARRFPIIRFDAAMVLARKSIQRLWFPEPGSGGGAIPSRAERALSRAAFDAAMPKEFWREVVDRTATEAPDTLLLAEAFWLMEGYFVRTLGMHRVYNSAFMHMLRDEKNAEYRLVMKNTLEFDPEVLKRYVNFMNNPDEKTALEQFGKGDKYFGVATLLATLPGLPMIGHGQVEGFAEKYGMEYRRAYHDEPVDEWLVARHEREIFPLLHRRAQFAEVRDFLLYDFVTDGGHVNEDVFAYSNGSGPSRSLVVYHNRFASTAGTIHDSVAYPVPTPGGERVLVRRTIAEGLGLPAENDGSLHLAFRDLTSGLEFVRSARELRERGLWLRLDAYARHVFLDFREVRDTTGLWGRLARRLAGGGVPSLERALAELVLEPVLAPFGRIVGAATIRGLSSDADAEAVVGAVAVDARELAEAAVALGGDSSGPSTPADEFVADVESGLRAYADLVGSGIVAASPAQTGAVVAWLAARGLGGGPDVPDRGEWCLRHFDDWQLAPVVAAMFHETELDEVWAWRRVDAVRATLRLPRWPTGPGRSRGRAVGIVAAWLADDAANRAIGVNRYENVLWFGVEAFDAFVELAFAVEAVRASESPQLRVPGPGGPRRTIRRARKLADELLAAGRASGYRVDDLRAALSPPGRAGAARTSGPRAGAPRSAP